MPSHEPVNSSTPVGPNRTPNSPIPPHGLQSPQPPRPAKPSGPARKLDPAMKDHIYRLHARGHSLLAIARIIGVNARTIYRERRRDPFFRQRLGEKGEEIADVCYTSLRAAAPTKPSAAQQLFRLVYPDRYYYKPATITLKQHEAWTNEVLGLFEDIATPKQMQELHQRLSPERKPKSRPALPDSQS